MCLKKWAAIQRLESRDVEREPVVDEMQQSLACTVLSLLDTQITLILKDDEQTKNSDSVSDQVPKWWC